MKKTDQGQTFITFAPGPRPGGAQRHGSKHHSMGKREAGEVAEAITQIETGQIQNAALRLRLLLRDTGHPEPARIQFEAREPRK